MTFVKYITSTAFENILTIFIVPLLILFIASLIKPKFKDKSYIAPELLLIWLAFDMSALISRPSIEAIIWEPFKHNYLPAIGILFLLELLLYIYMVTREIFKRGIQPDKGFSTNQILFIIFTWMVILLPTSVHFLLILHIGET